MRVATKYPNIARRHFAARGVHADVVHLNGAMELAPGLGLSRLIVDLVQTGSTLKANGLVETEVIAPITRRLIVNRTALKTQPEAIGAWIARFRAALGQAMMRGSADRAIAGLRGRASPRCWTRRARPPNSVDQRGGRHHRRRPRRAATRRCSTTPRGSTG